MCVTVQNCQKNSVKTLILKDQGGSRSSILIRLKTLSQMLFVISTVPIYNRFHTGRANSGKIWTF